MGKLRWGGKGYVMEDLVRFKGGLIFDCKVFA